MQWINPQWNGLELAPVFVMVSYDIKNFLGILLQSIGISWAAANWEAAGFFVSLP